MQKEPSQKNSQHSNMQSFHTSCSIPKHLNLNELTSTKIYYQYGGRRGIVVITLAWQPGGPWFKSHSRRKKFSPFRFFFWREPLNPSLPLGRTFKSPSQEGLFTRIRYGLFTRIKKMVGSEHSLKRQKKWSSRNTQCLCNC